MPRRRHLELKTERRRRQAATPSLNQSEEQRQQQHETFGPWVRDRRQEKMTDCGESESLNISIVCESLIKEESDLFPPENMEYKAFNLLNMMEEISCTRYENMETTAVNNSSNISQKISYKDCSMRNGRPNVSYCEDSLISKESNLSLSKEIDMKDLKLADVKEEILFVSCENTEMSNVRVKEEEEEEEPCFEVFSGLSECSYPVCSFEHKNETAGPCLTGEFLDGRVTPPFCFVGGGGRRRRKRAKPVNCESGAFHSSSVTKCSVEECRSSPDKESVVFVQGLKEKLRLKLSPFLCAVIKMEGAEVDDCSGESALEEAEEDINSEMVGGKKNDFGDASEEFIRGIECQDFPILQSVNQKEKIEELWAAVNRNNPDTDHSSSFQSPEISKEAEQIKKNSNVIVSVQLSQSVNTYPSGGNKLPEENQKNVEAAQETEYSCSQCNASFYDNHTLMSHMETHVGERRVYVCGVCGNSLKTKDNLRRHMATHSEKKPHGCRFCGARFVQKCNLKIHIRRHTGEKPFMCSLCDAKFPVKQSLEIHMRIHTGEKPYICSVCKKSFSSKGNHKVHMRLHSGEKPFTCNICSLSFMHKNTLNAHVTGHTGENRYICGICEKSFCVKSYLARHLSSHTGEKPYACSTCDAKFVYKSSLNSHMRAHRGEKAFACSSCPARFAYNWQLKAHVRAHLGQKPYRCRLCEGRFSQTTHLKRHMRVHTGEKPFLCSVCGQSFSDKGNFNKHLGTHDREKLYTCRICDAQFMKKYSLNTHVRTHSP